VSTKVVNAYHLISEFQSKLSFSQLFDLLDVKTYNINLLVLATRDIHAQVPGLSRQLDGRVHLGPQS